MEEKKKEIGDKIGQPYATLTSSFQMIEKARELIENYENKIEIIEEYKVQLLAAKDDRK